MNAATAEYLRQRFSAYYQKAQISVPPALEQREWGFLFFTTSKKSGMRRHMAFSSEEEVATYLRTMVPAHVYYSSAYYAFPAAATMNEKVWTGADLIFDLDADHIVHGAYDMMLARVRDETEKLLSMLTDELGFRKQDISLFFSGGRGYHVHIRDIAVRGWGSPERREMVDYVCGTNPDPGVMLCAHQEQAGGWPLRYREALSEYLGSIFSMEKAGAVKYLRGFEGIGKSSKLPAEFYARIPEYQKILSDPGSEMPQNRMLRAILADENADMQAWIREHAALVDEPVSTDIKRLIRMPGSLHGGSGLRVTPVQPDELPDFDPLTDAVVFGDEKVAVDVSMDLSMPLLGETFDLQKGRCIVPEAVAVFLCCRGLGEFAGSRRGK